MKTQVTAAFIVVFVLLAAMVSAAEITAPAAACAVSAPCVACPPGKEIKIWGGLDSKPKTAESYKPEKVTIGVGDFDLFEIKTAAAGYSLSEREVAIYNRLVEILSKGPGRPEAVCVGRVRSAPTIYVGNFRLVSVYQKDAEAAGMTQEALAEKWRARIAEVLPKVVTEGVAPKPAEVYEVAVGGQFLFRLRDKDGFPSLKARGVALEEQVVKMLSDGRKGRMTAQAAQVGNDWVVKYGELRLVTATAADACALGLTPQALAEKWTADLNVALLKLKSATGDANNPK